MHQLLSLLLLISFLPAPTDSTRFLSIDCGGKDAFTDQNNITWIGDADYVRTGERRYVQLADTVAKELSTLRVFTSMKRNCYTIPTNPGDKILVRLRFYYGNYDGMGSPPEFLLQFDANLWNLVSTTMDRVTTYVRIYVTKRKSTSICVARTKPEHFPFLSSIEVRTLKPEMYGAVNSSFALYLRSSVAFGANEPIRFPYDTYDRVWWPNTELYMNNFTILGSDTNFVSTNTTEEPPEMVFRTAAAPPENSTTLALHNPFLPAEPVPVYFIMYFSEMTNPYTLYGKRSFDIYVDYRVISDVYNPIVPPYQGVLEYHESTRNASEKTVFELVPTSNSSYSPIISAWEVLMISGILKEGTNEEDVVALGLLQARFEVLRNWTGDPCLPVYYNWEWVNCSSDAWPRVNGLFLGGYGLYGSLPDFSALDALELIDLHNNSLNGDIPEFFGKLSRLKVLNLADNDFTSIPTSLSQNTVIKLNVTGNPRLRVMHAPVGTPVPASGEAALTSENNLFKQIMFTLYSIFFITVEMI